MKLHKVLLTLSFILFSATIALSQCITPITIALDPVNETACVGDTVTFVSSATGDPAPTVQWQADTGTGFIDIAGAIDTSLRVDNVTVGMDGNQYRAIYTNACGPDTTTAATLTVHVFPAVDKQTTSAFNDACIGDTFTVSAAASGWPNHNIQWQADTGTGYFDITGATDTNYTVMNATDSDEGDYRAIFTNTCGADTSDPFTMTVNAAPPIVSSNDTTVCVGAGYSVTSSINGNDIARNALIAKNGSPLLIGTDINNASLTETIGSASLSDDGTMYIVTADNACGASADTGLVTVLTAPVVTTDPTNQTTCAGGNVNFTAAATGNPTPSVQWQVNTGGGFVDLAGDTNTLLSLTGVAAAQNNNQYRAIFTNTCGSDTTTSAILTVNTAPVMSSQPSNFSVCPGGTATFTAIATGSPAPSVQWQVSTGGPYVDLAGDTNTTLTLNNVTAGMDGNTYRARFTNICGNVTSSVATLTVYVVPVVTLEPLNDTVCEGVNAQFIAGSSGTPTPNIQWQENTGGGFADIIGANADTLTLTSATISMTGSTYRAIYTNLCGADTTMAARLEVDTIPVITLDPISDTLCEGEDIVLTASATGSQPISVQWQRGGVNIPGAMDTFLSITNFSISDTGLYRAAFTNSCGTTTTANARLTLNNFPDVVLNSNNSGGGSFRQIVLDACPGDTITFDPSTNGNPIVLTSGMVTIDKDLVIIGNGAMNTILDGNGTNRVLKIDPAVQTELIGMTLQGGSATNGGAVWLEGANVTMDGVEVRDNTATERGGGIYLSLNGVLDFINSTVAENEVTAGTLGYGGGIYVTDTSSTLRVYNSTVSGNEARIRGGGIYGNQGTLTVVNSTIARNNAASVGGGIYISSGADSLSIGNSIIAKNTASTNGPDIASIAVSTVSLGYNVIGDTADAKYLVTTGDTVGSTASPVDPILDILADNNGQTRTHQLLCYSPALNTGDPADTSTLDQRGSPRFVGQNDRGALESQHELAVDSPYVVADFALTPANGCATPHTVFFTFNGQFYNSIEWLFGDGTTSTAANPIHSYTTEGQFGATLVVRDTLTGCQDVKTKLVRVLNPVADFSGTPLLGCGPLTVDFTDASTDAFSWSWDFGDGNTSILQSPSHTYNDPGTYDVSLTVTSASGCVDVMTKNAYVQVTGPDVDFSADSLNGCEPFQLQFTDLTVESAPIVSWLWNFGDGNTSSLQNPGYAYGSDGTYTVSLTITDTDGCIRTLTKTNYIQVDPVANFAITPTQTICAGDSVELSVNGGVAYQWSTGATTRKIKVAPLAFTKYNVTVTSAAGCDATGSVLVFVNPLPNADAGANVDICFGETTTLTASGGITYRWNTGAGSSAINVSPTTTTTYMVTVTDANTCSKADSVTVTVNPLPVADAGVNDTICEGETGNLNATGGGSYLWSNGTAVAALSASPTITTSYTVTVTDGNSCTASDDAIIVVKPKPVVITSNATICIGDTATVSATGGGTYQWSTGATTSSIQVAPMAFAKYNVTVTGGNGCTALASPLVFVNPLPTANAGADDTICVGSSATLTASGGLSYAWSSGDNTASTTVAPATNTTYTVTVTDANGCKDTDDALVVLDTVPAVSAGNDTTICAGEPVTLTATGAAGLSYAWSSGDNTAATTVSPTGTTTYTVTATDGNGCEGTDDAVVTVNPLPNPTISGLQSTYCEDAPVDTLSGAPAGGTFSGVNLSGNLLDPGAAGGSYSVTYTVTDGNGCTDSTTNTYNVLALPTVSFTGLDTTYCIDTMPIALSGSPAGGTFSGPGVQGNYFTSYFAGVGTHQVVYSYTSPNGCAGTDTQTVTVYALPVLSFMPLDSSYCKDDPSVGLVATPTGGTFAGAGVASTTFTPADANLGNVAIVYSYTDNNGCMAKAKQIVIVNANPVLTFNLASQFCTDGDVVTLIAQPGGGTFGGNGVNGNQFVPALAGVGNDTIFYTYTNAAGCSDTLFKAVNVDEPDTATFTLPTAVCQNDPILTLSGMPSGGTFSGVGIAGNYFDPAAAGTGGPYDIVYTYANANGCVYTDTQSVTVNGVPFANIFGLDPIYCSYQYEDIMLSTGPAGGSLTGVGITSDTTFNPGIAGVGQHTLVYDVTNANGCRAIAKEVITVDPCTNIDEPRMNWQAALYPNPTSGWTNIALSGFSEGEVVVQVFDLQGKMLLNKLENVGNNNAQIALDLSGFATGLYYVKLTAGTDFVVKKVMVD